MKFVFVMLSASLLLACSSSKNTFKASKLQQEQVFLMSQNEGLPGKCYSKLMTSSGEEKWTQIYCDHEINKGLIKKMQQNLLRIGYLIDSEELDNSTFGGTTRASIVQFQKAKGLAYGGLDEATLHKLLNSK